MDKQENPFLSPVPVEKRTRLCWQWFVGASLDSNFRTFTSANWATGTQANAIYTIATWTSANGSGLLVSNVPAIFNSVGRNRFRWMFRNDIWVVNNIRYFWAATQSAWVPVNGFVFAIEQTRYVLKKYTAWVVKNVYSDSFSDRKQPSQDDNWHSYEISYNNSDIFCFVDGKVVHQESCLWQKKPLSWGFQLPIFIKNENINGSTTNVSMDCMGVSIFREWEIDSLPLCINITTAGTFTLKNNAGKIWAILVNSVQWTSCIVYDNVSATGKIIGTVQLNQIFTRYPNGWGFFYNGLTLVTSGATVNITVVRE